MGKPERRLSMKQFKRIMAFALALVLTLAMSITVFAEPQEDPSSGEEGGEETPAATIYVHNADGADISYVQIIQVDPTTKTGWAFTNAARSYFVSSGENEQTILESMTGENGTIAAEKLKNFQDSCNDYISFGNGNTSVTVSAAGVYAVKAEETGYTYNPMAAFVEAKYDESTGAQSGLKDADVYAKKTDNQLTKTVVNNTAHTTAIGNTETFQVKTTVPYGETSWVLTDTITGASYVTDTSDTSKVPVSVTVGTGDDATTYNDISATIKTGTATGSSSFELNLTSIATGTTAANSGTPVTITYQATVTGTSVTNSITANTDKNTTSTDPKTNEVKLFTGSITFTKYDADGAGGGNKLAGAKFYVKKGNDYAQFDNNVLSGWTEDETQATKVETTSEGTVTVSGLDVGTYTFIEAEAPTGYSLNTENKEVELSIDSADAATGVATKEFSATGSMTDTKLSPLPQAGGIGTTIFTIAGCLIMIAAAGMYFASRRKNAK
jgi:LPXTG-motif cell wall-anchored protein